MKRAEFKVRLLIWLSSRIPFHGSAFVLDRILDLNFSLAIFRFWDVGWYLWIINSGYLDETISSGPEIGRANWGFFPVPPLLVRFFAATIKVDAPWDGYFVEEFHY